MTHKDWEDEIKEHADTVELAARVSALETLRSWPTFKKEFGWTGIFSLSYMLQAEIERRGKA